MSDTPRTDAAWSSGFDPVVVSAAELARRLREECADLERDNAELRKLLREAITSLARYRAALGEEDKT